MGLIPCFGSDPCLTVKQLNVEEVFYKPNRVLLVVGSAFLNSLKPLNTPS